ncbi:Gfo/Idh/MocA family protein [Lentzea sp. E54]|uniref:Gfo/Idh/MocA family protein n=1 Tax=Lentzea xerophila TaxID=3435883 RepID=UPI003DA32640
MRLELGLIGATAIAERAIVRPSAAHDDIHVRAVAASDVTRAREFAHRNDIPVVHATYDALVADPAINTVYISLHNSAHHQWVVRAARAGKHVIVEKPLCLNENELAEIQSASGDVRVAEAVPTAGHPWQETVRRAIADRGCGELLQVRTELVFAPPTPGGYRDRPDLGGGIFLDTASYWLQAVQATVGLGGVTASGESAFDGPNGVDRSFEARLDWPDGRRANLHCAVGDTHVATHEFVFEQATMSIRNFLRPVLGPVPLNLVVRKEDREVIGFPARSYYAEQITALRDWLVDGTPWGGELPAAVERVTAMAAVYRAAQRRAAEREHQGVR